MPSMIEQIRRLRHTALPLPLKYGRHFRQVMSYLDGQQHLSGEELAEYQWGKMKSLLDYAYHHVRFYRERFDAIDLHPEDIRSRADWRRIPILSKDEVDSNLEALKSDEFDRLKPIETMTSATTRDHLRLYRSRETEIWRQAVVWRHFFNVGYRYREPRARLTTRLKFVKDNREMPIDYNENELLIDPTSLSIGHCPKIHSRLREFRPKMIICQPSNLTMLVQYFQEHNLEPIEIPIIYCLGEKVYPEYRQALTSFFGGEIVDYYANRENTAAACQFSDGNMYVQSEYCHLEFIDREGNEVVDEEGDIISTSLINRAFPLIRYNTDDIGIGHRADDDSRWHYPTMEVIGGRGKDLVLTRNGLRITQLWYYLNERGFDRFRQLQLEQLSMSDMLFRIVPNSTFRADADPKLVEEAVSEYFGGEFKVEVEVVDHIPATKGCKNQMVISPLAVDRLRDQLRLR